MSFLDNIITRILHIFHHSQAPVQPDLKTQNQKALDALSWQYDPNLPTPRPPAPPAPARSAAPPAMTVAQPPQPSGNFPLPDLSKSTYAPEYPKVIQQAYQIAKQYKLPPAAIIGQLAAEGRGTGTYAQSRNNYLSLGAYTDNPDNAYSYASPQANLQAYAHLITTDPRYSRALANRNNATRFIQEVGRVPYATDPNYVSNVLNSPEFRFYNDPANRP